MSDPNEKDLTVDNAPQPEGVKSPPPDSIDVLEKDLTKDDMGWVGSGATLEANRPTLEPFNLTKAQEKVRGRIAQWLVALLAAVVLFAFMTLWLFDNRVADLEKLLTIIFAPVITLVGTATGYYFGGKNSQDNGNSV